MAVWLLILKLEIVLNLACHTVQTHAFIKNWDQNPQIPVFMSGKIGSRQDLQGQDYSCKVHVTAEWGRGHLRGISSPSTVLPNRVTTVVGHEIQTSVLKA